MQPEGSLQFSLQSATCHCPKPHDPSPHPPSFLSFRGSTAPSGPGPPHCRGFAITLKHTTHGRTPLDECDQPVAESST